MEQEEMQKAQQPQNSVSVTAQVKKNKNQVEPMTGDYRDNISLIKKKARSMKGVNQTQKKPDEEQEPDPDINVIRQRL